MRHHELFNRCLASVALLLFIPCAVVFLYGAFRVNQAVDSLRQSFGGSAVEEDVPPEDECYDPGGGLVCAPGGADELPGGPGDVPATEVEGWEP